MPLINTILSTQVYEAVLLQIASILKDEVENQNVLSSIAENVDFYIERTSPYDNSENVVINVLFESWTMTQGSKTSINIGSNFFIDVYSRGFNSDSVDGDTDSYTKLYRYVGLIQNILSHPVYKTLNFDPKIAVIGGTNIESVNTDNSFGNQDLSYVRFARINFSVRINQFTGHETGKVLQGNDTNIKLEKTLKGYKLIFNN